MQKAFCTLHFCSKFGKLKHLLLLQDIQSSTSMPSLDTQTLYTIVLGGLGIGVYYAAPIIQKYLAEREVVWYVYSGKKSHTPQKNKEEFGSVLVPPRPIDPDLNKLVKEAALKRMRISSHSRKMRGTTARRRVSITRTRRKPLVKSETNNLASISITKLSKSVASKVKSKNDTQQYPEDRALALAIASMVHTDGVTVFRIIPTLPSPDMTTHTLCRIAHEFLPIIHRRGYRIRSVSEFYAENGKGDKDSDGLDYELGGRNRCVQPGDKIKGHELSHVLGYNKIATRGGWNARMNPDHDHTIHLRLRHRDNVDCFFTYDEVVRTMAHELAHCVHKHHGDSFFELMRDILEEYMVFHGLVDESEEDSWFIFD